jgi:signal transduction histidine kinase
MTEPERQVTFRIAEGLTAIGDPELLYIVLDNLIGNAWKYTGRQKQAVIDLGSTEHNGTTTYFVRDNGPGFSMADAEKLFIPFNRLPGTAEFIGHGIGLATVDRIIRRHNGKLWAEAVPGSGATFYFTLHP